MTVAFFSWAGFVQSLKASQLLETVIGSSYYFFRAWQVNLSVFYFSLNLIFGLGTCGHFPHEPPIVFRRSSYIIMECMLSYQTENSTHSPTYNILLFT